MVDWVRRIDFNFQRRAIGVGLGNNAKRIAGLDSLIRRFRVDGDFHGGRPGNACSGVVDSN